jgi:RNA polymerase sigma-70 factor, ECF subfamily
METQVGIVERASDLSDEEVGERVVGGDNAMFEVLMRRHNQRLFRTARAIVKDDAEAEDVLQEAYLRAFSGLSAFEGRSRLSTWLTRIVVHGALARVRRGKKLELVDPMTRDDMTADADAPDPEEGASSRELAAVLEKAIDGLPESFRVVLVLRLVEDLSVAETAACLEIPEDTVKTRLYRARHILQRTLLRRTDAAFKHTFEFGSTRCDRVVASVLLQILRAPEA